MLRTDFQRIIAIAALSLLANAAHAQFCVTSDGNQNTACGSSTPAPNRGIFNAAFGYQALQQNVSGSDNVALGVEVLQYNTTGGGNTGVGAGALNFNTASNNTAVGNVALSGNLAGSYNTGSGVSALYFNQNGNYNTATGALALASNTVDNNTAVGYESLAEDTTGANNVALGYQAGVNITTGSYNIDIGNPGLSTDSNIIKIGLRDRQVATFIAGIANSPVTGAAVYVNAVGRLGVLPSSERYKTDVAPLKSASDKLHQLRPVSFHLKTDPYGAVQYGLIAEEVDKVYPELVIRDEAGQIQGVRYDELAPMLLNVVQEQAAEIRRLNDRQGDLEARLAELSELKQELRAAMLRLQSKDEWVARR